MDLASRSLINTRSDDPQSPQGVGDGIVRTQVGKYSAEAMVPHALGGSEYRCSLSLLEIRVAFSYFKRPARI